MSACSCELRAFCDFCDIFKKPVTIAEIEEVGLRAEDVVEEVEDEVGEPGVLG